MIKKMIGLEGRSGPVRLALVIGVVMGALWAPLVARADSTPTPPPGWNGSYKVISPNGRHMLVMVGNIDCAPCLSGDDWIGESNALSEKYSVSGMYRNDGSVEPMWTMGYVSWRQQLWVSSDGHHVAVRGDWPGQGGEYREEAFSFYEDGKVLRSYEVRDLAMNPERLPHFVSHYEWEGRSLFDGNRNTLNVVMLTGEEYTFDVGTGEVLRAVVSTPMAGKWQVSATTVAESVDPYDVLYLPRQAPGLPVWAALGIGGVSFACLLGGVEVARKRSKRRRDMVRVRRVVWRVPVRRG